MTVLRACLDCGRPSPGSRCELHRDRTKRLRNANTAAAREVVRAQPWCSDCGATRDLTSDHVVPISESPTNAGPQRTLCRPCNSRRGGALSGSDGPRGRQ